MGLFGSIARRLTYANVVATLALFIALGGASYAVVSLPEHSVGARQLARGAVTDDALAFPLAMRLFQTGETLSLHEHRCNDQPPGVRSSSCIVVPYEAVPLGHLTLKAPGTIALIASGTVEDAGLAQPLDTAVLKLLVNRNAVATDSLEIRDLHVPHQFTFEAAAPGRAGRNSVGLFGDAAYGSTNEDGTLRVTSLSVIAIALPRP